MAYRFNGDMTFSPQADSPMFVVTCQSDDTRGGCLVGFATQCGIEPPRFLVCLSMTNRTYEIAVSATALAVHVLSRNNRPLASLFGEDTGDQVDKFAAVSWRPGVTGAPILTDCTTSFEGNVIAKIPFGDHVGFVLARLSKTSMPAKNLTESS
jgi:flavin reductase (DIM6/NTAB) family NADH-FMN oxidoreductase RutF